MLIGPAGDVQIGFSGVGVLHTEECQARSVRVDRDCHDAMLKDGAVPMMSVTWPLIFDRLNGKVFQVSARYLNRLRWAKSRRSPCSPSANLATTRLCILRIELDAYVLALDADWFLREAESAASLHGAN